MLVADSSVWLEWFTNGERADVAERLLGLTVHVTVLVYHEVFKFIHRERGLDDARTVAATILARASENIEPLEQDVALAGARLCVEERPRMAMADALILAQARHIRVPLVSLDHHFENRAGALWWPKGPHRQRAVDPEWPAGW